MVKGERCDPQVPLDTVLGLRGSLVDLDDVR